MTEFLTAWGQSIGKTILESAPYVLLGLFVAGLFRVFLPAERVTRHLGRGDLRSVVLATLFGAPLPLCSCSVIPAAVELRRKGASKGATTAFLISTPETGIDQMGITYALLDPIMMISRPLAGIATSIGAGVAVNWIEKSERSEPAGADASALAALPTDPCCADTSSATKQASGHCEVDPVATAQSCADPREHAHDHGHDHSHSHEHGLEALSAANRGSFLERIREAIKYAFGPMLAELTPWFILGFALSGLIEILIPNRFFGDVIPGGIVSILLMLVIGVPMYVCATASTPVAAAMIAKGLDPGAALVFMLAGPATNLGTMLIVGSMLGRRVLVAYIGMITAASVVFGLALNAIYSGFDIDLGRTIREGATSEFGFWTYASCAVFVAGMLIHATRDSLLAKFEERLTRMGVTPSPRVFRYAVALLLAVAWGLTGLSVAGPGETGFVTRFGKVVETITGPGYSMHLPYPIDRFETVATGSVERVVVGGEESAPQEIGGMVLPMDAESSSDQIECVTGDEKLLLVSYTVHYHALDAYEWRFAIRDVSTLVTAASHAAIRRMVGRRSMDEHLIERREPLEHETRGYLQESLTQVSAGIEVLDVNLEYIHAPSQVHFAYRDVASSLEDKQTAVKNGEAYEKEWLALTRGEAEKMVEKAEGERAAKVALANGAVAAYLALSKVAAEDAASQVRVRDQLLLRSQLRAWVKPALTALLAKNVQVIGSSTSERSPERAAEAEDR